MTQKSKTYTNSFSGKGVFPPKYAFTLLIPLRSIFLSPGKLARRLHLKDDHIVLEIGPGPGYFSPHIARKVPQGRLVLFDIQQEMLDLARKRLTKRNIHNVDYSLSNGYNLNFCDAFYDRIFMVTVIGEIDNQERYLAEIHRVLKKDGLLSISELAGDPDKITRDDLKALLSASGFYLHEAFGNERNYTMNFKKKH